MWRRAPTFLLGKVPEADAQMGVVDLLIGNGQLIEEEGHIEGGGQVGGGGRGTS